MTGVPSSLSGKAAKLLRIKWLKMAAIPGASRSVTGRMVNSPPGPPSGGGDP
jgi:hypothetical protein